MTESPNPAVVDPDTLTGDMRPIRRVVLSIGSNLGERLLNLQGAVDSLEDTPEVWVTDVSPVYETAPVGAPEGSPDFLNAVVGIDTTLSAVMLLDRAQAIEAAYGRDRSEVEPNAPRTLDIDLIVVGEKVLDSAELVLPHPRAAERAFVLVPWLDIDPEAVLPGVGPIAALAESLDRGSVVRRDDLALVQH